jgi:di/tricarboxylate transporter
VAGATATVVAIVTFILAVAGVMGYGPFVLALIIAVVCSMLFRRGVSR